ncbi:molecular chaperone [Aerosakkonemataceae cyanobacterium BLCC-F50]|uniref:Molecular chaperone n=1 Tax=Floridaenema flaviceps BLCC-F50 TaxID=3153642 RepID=A0ABV4XIR5_9CYAN
MPVEIRLLPRFQLRIQEDDERTLELPTIEFAPSESNIPHIFSIICSVRGTPSELAVQIQQTYKGFRSDTPRKLSSLAQLGQYPCRLDQPLTQSVNCYLQVTVEYSDSDETGNPLLSVRNHIAASCHLWFPDPQQWFPGFEELPIESPVESTSQSIKSTLTKMNPEQSSNNSAKKEKRFPGWFAVDFGTSNSTVTLFDPMEVPIAELLPKEQEVRLRERLLQWLSSPSALALPNVSAGEWEKFIGEISKNLEIESSQLGEVLTRDNKEIFLEVIRQIELCLGNNEKFRRPVRKQLYQIYHEVFRVPALESQNLIPVILDIDRRAAEISSEVEIVSLAPLKVEMGNKAKQKRQSAIAQSASNSLKEIISKFHHSPKRYFGQERSFKVFLNGEEETIEVKHLIQAAWEHLKDLTEDYRKRARRNFSIGNFCTAVVTYPTVAPPLVRKQVKELVEELGIDDVQIAYDEAVSVAIFFLWREFGGNLNIGIESFKTRCHKNGNKWSQNILVLDIGGGTTDLALIELTLEDKTPSFAHDEDRGLGGRYYKLTPKLLGSSGHLQLGGELITLRMFRLLKVAIADSLLSAVTVGNLSSDKLEDLINSELNERFLEQGKFKSGSLLKYIDRENPESDSAAYKDVLDTAEKVLPTRWEQAPQRLQTFYTLWDHAEDAKLKLGQKPLEDGSLLTFTLSEQEISQLLNQSGIKFQINDPNSICVIIDSQQFERTVGSVIREALGIAKGLIESRLRAQDIDKDNTITQKVDWLILSGKTCNLDLVQRQIYQEFSKSPYFVWNPERITFVLEFTKLATSAGACYAEKLRRFRFDPEESKELLRKGANQLEIDVKNLFYYLPCNFTRKTQSNEQLSVFKAGQELYQLASSELVAKVRTNWAGIQLSNIIHRQDYEDGDLRLWGSFDGKKLMEKLKMEEHEFLNKIKIQFEIDQTLQFNVLLCRGNPHYLIPVTSPSIDVEAAILTASPSAGRPTLFSEGKLRWNIAIEDTDKDLNHGDIAINVIESATVDQANAYHLVFEAERDDNKTLKIFRYENGVEQQQGNGLMSNPLPPFPKSGKHTFYFYHFDPETNTKKWIRIGELSKPDITTDYPCQYRVTLDEKGILRMHAGEVPYWTSNSEECLKQEGCVFRTQLELQPNEVDKERDPFSGIH